MTTTSLIDSVNIELPSTRGNNYIHAEYLEYLHNIQKRNANIEFQVGAYTHGASLPAQAYQGAVYSPTQNRLYLIPYAQADDNSWHYIDCTTGNVITYTHGATVVDIGYFMGVYSPTQNRIYLCPYYQCAQENWHYINCNTGAIVAYAHGMPELSTADYAGGVYSPTQNRIYLIPYGRSDAATWHYIDCTSTGAVVAYSSTCDAAPATAGYYAGAYSPTQNRIYLIPFGQSDQDHWHYIDCDDTTVHSYAHGMSGIVDQAYAGGGYSPTQNRIYFNPAAQGSETNWHYIDCNTGNVVAYAHGIGINSGGLMYSPTQNRLYMIPMTNAVNWHYVDCNVTTSTGMVVSYTNNATIVANNAYAGGCYVPSLSRIYLCPFEQTNQNNWHYIQEFSDEAVELPTFMVSV